MTAPTAAPKNTAWKILQQVGVAFVVAFGAQLVLAHSTGHIGWKVVVAAVVAALTTAVAALPAGPLTTALDAVLAVLGAFFGPAKVALVRRRALRG